jgi:3-methyladenine DNA glycosylase/8-oxoguanine DNA glycosylase
MALATDRGRHDSPHAVRSVPAGGAGSDGLDTAFRPDWPLDPWATLAPLRHGFGDPTVRYDGTTIWRATRTPVGPATLRIHTEGGAIRGRAWGPGAGWVFERLPALLGADDRPALFEPRHRLLRELVRRMPGLRFGRTDAVFEAVLPAIVEQKVTGTEARRSYRLLILRYGEPAPGPGGLRLAPAPEVLAGVRAFMMHPLGLEARRAETIRRAAVVARRLEEAVGMSPEMAMRRLRAVPGIGTWTAAEAARVSLGDPDAVSIGDYHVPSLVSWALAGEPRADDARMLELLEPYRGQRARVVRLLEAAGLQPPRFGPRMSPRSIAAL